MESDAPDETGAFDERNAPYKYYLLDTNILVHYLRGDATGQRIRRDYTLLLRDPKPAYSIVSEGEIRSLAEQWQWGETRLEQMEFCLGYFERLTIEIPEIIAAYAVIDSATRKQGFRMGKNDLWIAATAYVTGATLLTTDADFDHLPQDFFAHERVPVVP